MSKTPEELEKEAKEVLKKMNEENITLKEAMDIDERFLEEIYRMAYSQYEQGLYKDAINNFKILATASPDNHKYLMGLAACFHQQKEYEEAAEVFLLALHIDQHDPSPVFYLADCFQQLGREKEAIEYYKMLSALQMG